MAKLYFTHGTMGAQKTTDLLATAYNFEEHGGKVLITKPATDTKGDADVVSRVGLRRSVDFLTTPEMDIEAEVLRRGAEVERISAVLVDEAQFLQHPSQVVTARQRYPAPPRPSSLASRPVAGAPVPSVLARSKLLPLIPSSPAPSCPPRPLCTLWLISAFTRPSAS